MVNLRKIFAASVIFVTVLSMSAVAAPAGATAAAGSLIKMNGLSTVYYLGADAKRYVFPNEQTYLSWYKDFSSVVTVPQSELESYPLGANVTIRPGTKLVKITTNPTVYAVEPGGTLRSIVSEANAIALWGANWAKRVVDVPDAFFTNYKTASALTAGVYPVGSLVKTSSSADVFYFDGTNFKKFANEAAFSANRLDMANVVTTTVAISPIGADITGGVSTLTDTSSGAGGSAGAGTGLTVSLSSTTAPSNTIISGQAVANLASFNFTASNDGAVSVTTLKLKKTGIVADAVLANVYLYDGNTRISDSASVSSGYVTFSNASGVVNVAAGTSRTVTVKADIASGYSGNTVGVSINAASDITTNGASVSGAFPQNGSLMSIATASDFATVNIATSSPTPTTNTSVDIQNDYTMWQDTVTVGQRAVNLSYFSIREIGSIAATDLGNFRLFVDGIQVGNAVSSMDANGYVSFDLSGAPKRMETGSRIVKVLGDIKGGSTRTFSFSLRQASDIVVVDSQYGANVLVTVNGGTFTTCTTGSQQINSGSLTVTKSSDSPSGNVIVSASGITLAKYTLTAVGEPIKIETLNAGLTGSSAGITSLRNGALFANGVQIGSTANLTSNTQFTVNYTVTPGTDVALEIRADVFDTASSTKPASGDTIQVQLIGGSNNAQGVNSFTLKSIPSTSQAGNAIQVTTGTMTLSKTGSYGNQNTTVPQTQPYKLGSYVLTGNSNEDINLNTIIVGFSASGTFPASYLSDVYVKYGTQTGTVKSTVGNSGNTWSINQTLAKNTTITIEVWGKINSSPTSTNAITSNLEVDGTTAMSGQAASQGPTNGQTITVATGSLTTAVDASSPVSKVVSSNQTVDVAAFKFNAVNDGYTITDLTATTSANGATVVTNVVLKDGSTVLATQPFNGSTVTFSGLTVSVPANGSKVLTVALQLNGIGSGAGTSGANVQVSMSTFKANSSAGTQQTGDTGGVVKRDGNVMYAYKSIPTITNVSLPSATLITGTNVLAKITVAADSAGDIAWDKIVWTVGKSAGGMVISTSTIKLYDESGAQVLGTMTGATLGGTDTAGSITFVPTNEQAVAAGTSHTYTLKADVTSLAGGANNYVTTNIANPSSFQTSVAASSVTGSFVWSDTSASGHTTSTTDWTGDYLIKNLATDSQTVSVNL